VLTKSSYGVLSQPNNARNTSPENQTTQHPSSISSPSVTQRSSERDVSHLPQSSSRLDMSPLRLSARSRKLVVSFNLLHKSSVCKHNGVWEFGLEQC
jgi:hypothetical protein